MKTTAFPVSVLETLESRLAPAGLVTVNLSAAGALTLNGDLHGNDFQITESADGTQWTLSNLADGSGTTKFSFNGGAQVDSLTFDAPLSLKATLGDGDDKMVLQDTFIPKTLNVNTGNGNDIVKLSSALVTGNSTIVMGNGDDTFEASGVLSFKALNVNLGKGENVFDINADTLDMTGNLLAQGGGTIYESQYFGLKTGDGHVNGSVTLKSTTGSPTSFAIGALPDDLLQITKGMTLQSAGGTDAVDLQGDIKMGGLFAVKLGHGTNSLTSADLGVLHAKGMTYTGGKDGDTLSLLGSEVIITGNLTLSTSHGENYVNLNSTYLGTTGNLSYSGGTGTDDVLVEAGELVVNGSLSFKGSNGYNYLDFNTATALGISKNLTYSGGIDDDTMILDGPDVIVNGQVSMSASHGSNKLLVNAGLADLGSFRYTGGTGGHIIDIGQFEGASEAVTVWGNTVINAGPGTADIQFRNAVLKGTVGVTTNADVRYGDTDQVLMLESEFNNHVNINMRGSADSTVEVRNGIFDGKLLISTGAGNDEVWFDTVTDVPGIRSWYYDYVRVNLGAGDDGFYAGTENTGPGYENFGNDFQWAVDVFGGSGDDTALFGPDYNNTFPDDPSLEPLAYDVETAF